MASLEVGDEGGAQKTTFCHQPIFQILSERKDHFKTKFNGDPDEPPGHAYENIGPLSSPPPGFTMPPKPRWRYTALNIGKHQQIKGGKNIYMTKRQFVCYTKIPICCWTLLLCNSGTCLDRSQCFVQRFRAQRARRAILISVKNWSSTMLSHG